MSYYFHLVAVGLKKIAPNLWTSVKKQIGKKKFVISVDTDLNQDEFLKELDKQKPDFRITLKVVKKLVYIKNKIAFLI